MCLQGTLLIVHTHMHVSYTLHHPLNSSQWGTAGKRQSRQRLRHHHLCNPIPYLVLAACVLGPS